MFFYKSTTHIIFLFFPRIKTYHSFDVLTFFSILISISAKKIQLPVFSPDTTVSIRFRKCFTYRNDMIHIFLSANFRGIPFNIFFSSIFLHRSLWHSGTTNTHITTFYVIQHPAHLNSSRRHSLTQSVRSCQITSCPQFTFHFSYWNWKPFRYSFHWESPEWDALEILNHGISTGYIVGKCF